MTFPDYRHEVEHAMVYDLAIKTPLVHARKFSAQFGHTVHFKREELQPVFSFKLRGAFNKMAHLAPEQRLRGVICASAGNHAQGVALSAKHFGCPALIVMPVTTPLVKVMAVQQHGAQTVLFGESYSDAYQHALTLEQEQGLTFVHPFDDPLIIAGQGTIAREILEQHPNKIDAIFVPIGGGGLLAGIAAYIKAVAPHIRVIGVQTLDSNAMYLSKQKGERVALSEVGLFADGTAVKQVGAETFRIVNELVDDIILVDTDILCAGILDAYNETRMILEPSGALSVAGVRIYAERYPERQNETLIAITSGANMNFDRLRFVAERAELGEAREAIFAVTMPEERGSFLRFCALLDGRNMTEFNYRMSDTRAAHVFVGIAIRHRNDQHALMQNFSQAGFDALDISQDELAKLHLRHMIGGKSALVTEECLYRFEFPEKPGALLNFLNKMAPSWNISLFHYRNHGADVGRVLVGIQVPANERNQLAQFIQTLGYVAVDETHNLVYRLFLGQ